MFNRVCIQGNLVRDPDWADTKDTDILNFTVASTRKYKQKEETVFIDCTAYGATAENVAKFFSKGSPIGVEGRLCLNQWEDRDGNKRSKIYITIDAFHFVGQTGDREDRDRGSNRERSTGRGTGSNNRRGSRDNSKRSSNRARQGGRNERQEDNRYDDNIPF